MSMSYEDVNNTCPCCKSGDILVFHRINNIPVNSVLNMSTRETALTYPKGNVALGFCRKCGFIYNTAFDPQIVRYSSNCEETQGFSPRFNEFLRETAEHLIRDFDLHHKDILEIGCGKGEFLNLLCELGENRGLGFDPAYSRGRERSKNANKITFIKDFYGVKYAEHHADLICCRMTLEHISETARFMEIVRRSIGDRMDTIVFFQVPNVIRILNECAFEDIYYEHCSYFSPGSLARLFRRCGFEVLNLRTVYNDQYVTLEAKPVMSVIPDSEIREEEDPEKLREYVAAFHDKYKALTGHWEEELQEIARSGKKAVVWGSGSKAVSFLTSLPASKHIEYVVDINPYRQGSYMAGTGQLVVAPDFLQRYKPDIVIIMNSIYRVEILQELDKMGLSPELRELGKRPYVRNE